ncbi:MAG: sigma-54 dependent transcriptional regulator [Bacteroidetes bacterium]|nr:sigma-54 dependent transcriptional regulator [Bacteroidota bacterium]MBU1116016.1 sigma-54 dependent transcriptional regulator [Bacteroidota bacterium]MBU1799216.1 sigma-54 dependent transcriptional regulator [Bacteroidota bacterium]
MTTEEFQKKHGIIGKSKRTKDLVDIIMQVADADISILLTGESGVGKEIFARAIHESSKRTHKNLVNVNCGAIPEGLLESELFGHEKGSFTGATDVRKGYFEIADKGTLFLDEIGEMSLTTQVKLLRVLETNEFMRLGSERVTSVDVRIIAATNKSLEIEVQNKRFRNDLYFRLKAVTLTIPPLRERREDILPLADYFIKNYSERNNLPQFEYSDDVTDLLLNYYWPGNIRELKNTIESALALNSTGKITAKSFNLLLSKPAAFKENMNLPVYLDRPSDALDREMIYRALIDIKKDINDLKNIARLNYNNIEDNSVQESKIIPISDLEKNAIKHALDYTKWNKKLTSKLLNISERTLYRKLKEYEIN